MAEPAFPRPAATVTTWNADGRPHYETHLGHEGMSLRDWYAGQALPGVLVARAVAAIADTSQGSIAAECFEIAAAMLAARAKTPEAQS